MIPNYDPEAGIHYGAISMNSLDGEVSSDLVIGPHSTDVGYENAKNELLDKIIGRLEEELVAYSTYSAAVEVELRDLYYGDSRKQERSDVADEIVDKWEETEHTPETKEADREAIWEIVSDRFGDTYDGGEIQWYYKDEDGYVLQKCLDNDAIVIKSPYYTFAPGCSPCVPNAGNLDSAARLWEREPDEGLSLKELSNRGMKTYCVGHDWFEDKEAPYPVFSVATNNLIVVRHQQATCPTCKGAGKVRDKGQEIDILTSETIGPEVTVEHKCWRCGGKGTITERIEEEIDGRSANTTAAEETDLSGPTGTVESDG